MKERIIVDPEVMVGKPVIRGTRIPVDLILKLIAQGMTVEEILEDYPHITREDIKAALEYGAKIVRGEHIFPLIKEAKHAQVSG